MTVSIYLSGATGFIGGSILTALLESKKDYSITALVRSEEKAKALNKLGVKTVIGDLDSSSLIEEQAFKSDLVITSANCDHLGEAKAVVAGLRRKLKETGKRGLYLQTSGTSILNDDSEGKFEGKEIYSDADTEKVNAIPATNPHRHVDTYIIDNSADYDLTIIAPPCIYGEGTGPEGISKRRSQQIPTIIRQALKHGAVKQIGQGKHVWSSVDVKDLSLLYALVAEHLIARDLKTLGREGYFFAETGEFQWGEMCRHIAKYLYSLGAIKKDVPDEVNTNEEFKAAYGTEEAKVGLSNNSRSRAEKGRALGWKPTHKAQDVFTDAERECRLIAKELGYIQ
jgi:nucleoside-diphosphate-sugar epimerase